MSTPCTPKEEWDPEWIELLLHAKKLGCTPEEIRHFFESTPPQNQEENRLLDNCVILQK